MLVIALLKTTAAICARGVGDVRASDGGAATSARMRDCCQRYGGGAPRAAHLFPLVLRVARAIQHAHLLEQRALAALARAQQEQLHLVLLLRGV